MSLKTELDCVNKLLRGRCRLAVDAGANRGEYTAELLKYYPEATVILFEPSSYHIENLKTRFADKNTVIINSALSNEVGSQNLCMPESGSGFATLAPRACPFGVNFSIKETVSTLRFDDFWVTQLNSKLIDLIKLDIEGFEFAALEGAAQSMLRTRLVQFEFGPANIATKTYFLDFYQFFTQKNFQIFRITPLGLQRIKRYRERDEYFASTNFLAVNLALS